jgi:hypothetical protein
MSIRERYGILIGNKFCHWKIFAEKFTFAGNRSERGQTECKKG